MRRTKNWKTMNICSWEKMISINHARPTVVHLLVFLLYIWLLYTPKPPYGSKPTQPPLRVKLNGNLLHYIFCLGKWEPITLVLSKQWRLFKYEVFVVCDRQAGCGLSVLPLLARSYAAAADVESRSSGWRIQHPIYGSTRGLPHSKCIWM